MKKFLRVFLIFIGVFFLASCGSKIETKTFVGSPQDGIDSTLTYTYQGDKVLTQTAKNIVSYDKLGITKEEAKTALEPVSKQYEDIKGLDYKLTYEKLDYDKAKKVDGIQIDGDSSKGISMKKSQELVESQGYTEQK